MCGGGGGGGGTRPEHKSGRRRFIRRHEGERQRWRRGRSRSRLPSPLLLLLHGSISRCGLDRPISVESCWRAGGAGEGRTWLSYAVSKPITRMPSGPARRQCSGGWPTSLRSISVVGVVVVLGGVGCRGERESARRQTGLMGRFLPPRREKRAAKAKWHRAAETAAAEFRN